MGPQTVAASSDAGAASYDAAAVVASFVVVVVRGAAAVELAFHTTGLGAAVRTPGAAGKAAATEQHSAGAGWGQRTGAAHRVGCEVDAADAGCTAAGVYVAGVYAAAVCAAGVYVAGVLDAQK